MAQQKPTEFIESYLRSAGIGKRMKPERFHRQMLDRFGRAAAAVFEQIEQRADGNSDHSFWRLKNHSLELSLHLSAQFMSDFYRQYWPSFVALSNAQREARILDVGCDNGALTCCYAKYFPNAEVVGIDNCAEAIECATALAKRLGLHNVHFRVDEILTPLSVDCGSFDLVTATMTLHSVIEIPAMPVGFSLSQLDLPDPSPWIQPLMRIRKLVEPNGHFINVERLTSSAGILWWAQTLSGAGFSIDWPTCEVLAYSSLGERHRLPMFVCNTGHPILPSSHDVLAFWSQPELVELATKPIEGDAAEAFFESFHSDHLIWGIEGSCRHEGVEVLDRFETWEAGAVILAYSYSNLRVRRLVIGPRHKRQECIEHARRTWRERPYDSIREYASIAERDATAR